MAVQWACTSSTETSTLLPAGEHDMLEKNLGLVQVRRAAVNIYNMLYTSKPWQAYVRSGAIYMLIWIRYLQICKVTHMRNNATW